MPEQIKEHLENPVKFRRYLVKYIYHTNTNFLVLINVNIRGIWVKGF
jgi:hypothetical protein